MLTLIDEYTRECVAIRVARRLGRYFGVGIFPESEDVIVDGG